MNDCIERKKAIELIQPHVKPQTVYGEGYLQAIEHATDILELMPAADVQPVKHGKWVNECIEDEENVWWAGCSVCGEDTHSRYGRVSTYNYCPNCGARMDGDSE